MTGLPTTCQAWKSPLRGGCGHDGRSPRSHSNVFPSTIGRGARSTCRAGKKSNGSAVRFANACYIRLAVARPHVSHSRQYALAPAREPPIPCRQMEVVSRAVLFLRDRPPAPLPASLQDHHRSMRISPLLGLPGKRFHPVLVDWPKFAARAE